MDTFLSPIFCRKYWVDHFSIAHQSPTQSKHHVIKRMVTIAHYGSKRKQSCIADLLVLHKKVAKMLNIFRCGNTHPSRSQACWATHTADGIPVVKWIRCGLVSYPPAQDLHTHSLFPVFILSDTVLMLAIAFCFIPNPCEASSCFLGPRKHSSCP